MLINSIANADTINVLVGFPPGGGQYIVGQIVEDGLRELGYQAQLTIKPGAGGVVAMNECMKKADLKTLCLTAQSQLIYTNMLSEETAKYSPESIAYIKMIGESPLVLLTHIDNTKSLTMILEDIRNNKVTFGNGALGNSFASKKLMEHVKAKNAIDVTYKGAGPAIMDLMGKHIDYSVAPYTAVKNQVDKGLIRIVANLDESSYLDNVPRIPKFSMPAARFGFVASSDIDAETLKIHDKILTKLMDSKTVQTRLVEQGIFIPNKNLTGNDYKYLTLQERAAISDKK